MPQLPRQLFHSRVFGRYLYKWIRLIGSLLSFMVLAGCAATHDSALVQDAIFSDPFIRVDGTRFIKQGKPYYYVGTNFWYGAYLGADKSGQERLVRELDDLKRLGITNLRVLAASENTELKRALNDTIHLAPGQYNENLWLGLDFLLDELAKRDMHAVLFLNNFWQWSGGMAQYMSWESGKPVLDPDVTGDWASFIAGSASFYGSHKAQQWYRQLIHALVTRTNSVNGKLYRNDAAIMAWELANEPRSGKSSQRQQEFIDWLEQTALYIKALDSNHLVTSGSEGAAGSLDDIALFERSHSTSALDYLTFHIWPKNWSWYDAQNPEQTLPSSIQKTKQYILDHIAVAERLNKPSVLEEFGLERDYGNYALDNTAKYRDRYFKEVFDLIEEKAESGAAISGSNFWAWAGEGRAQHSDFWWQDGDPYTGDPPQEHQGLNSVFDTDSSTLKILSDHAKAMEALSQP